METHLQFETLTIKDGEDKNHTIEQHNPLAPPPPPSAASPSDEFSFDVVALEKSPAKDIPENKSSTYLAQDPSPADEIFFHGQLLPLHGFPPPPYSTDSPDDHFFTLPIDTTTSSSAGDELHHHHHLQEQRSTSKSKSFSKLFSLPIRLKRKTQSLQEDDDRRTQKRKPKLDAIRKYYVGLVKPFLVSFRRNKRDENRHRLRPASSSFSGDLLGTKRESKGFGDWGSREYSAPASMIHSPKMYSGVLAASGSVTPTTYYYSNDLISSTDSSTVEDLREAIQAAIAHCKKSNNSDALHERIEG